MKRANKKSSDSASETLQAEKATTLLKNDHATVRALFKEFKKAEDDTREKARLHQEIDRELSVHAQVEEEIFYPAVRAIRSEDAVRQVLEANEEHLLVKNLLAELRGMKPTHETFDAKMKVVIDLVEHHAEEEEDEMFDSAEELEKEELLELGARMQARKEDLQVEFDAKGQLSATRAVSKKAPTSRPSPMKAVRSEGGAAAGRR